MRFEYEYEYHFIEYEYDSKPKCAPSSRVVVTAPDRPEKVMRDLKAWASRRLREAFNEPADRDRWTQHGSTRWINDEPSLESAIVYVLEEQGEPMACYDGRG